jgi:alkaline phosphatase D
MNIIFDFGTTQRSTAHGMIMVSLLFTLGLTDPLPSLASVLLSDFGVNDGGKYVPEIPMRRKLYLSFLNSTPADDGDASESSSSSSLSHPQNEIFHTFVIGTAPAAIRFILLDTRSYREDHWIRSMGEYKFIPLSALFAAGIRLIYTSLGYGLDHSADMLGEKQWDWLEQVIQRSTGHLPEDGFIRADFHVVVSSVQILTSNPIVESWNHFPVAKKRLMNLFQKYNPLKI